MRVESQNIRFFVPIPVEKCDANGIDSFRVQSIAHADTHAYTQTQTCALAMKTIVLFLFVLITSNKLVCQTSNQRIDGQFQNVRKKK